MTVELEHLEISFGRVRYTEAVERLVHSTPGMGPAVEAGHSLAEMAVTILRGYYPTESLNFWWGEALLLPWYVEDPQDAEEKDGPSGGRLRREIDQILVALRGVNESEEHMLLGPITYLCKGLPNSEADTVRGICVEVLICVDRYLNRLVSRRTEEAIPWLSAAHFDYTIAIDHCRRVLTSSQAVRAASVRNVEHRELREAGIAYFRQHENEFSSLASAAEAITKQVPVTWTTARKWITEEMKSRRARL